MKKSQLKNLPAAARRALAGKRTWIEIDSRAAKKNYETFRGLVGPKVKLWSVVKSNAYGHGLMLFSKLMEKLGVDGFCVDSLVEGLRLRKEGIKKPILVLGPTLPALFKDAAKQEITITISNFEALKALAREKHPPEFHLKIDTGMHRQGFYLEDVPKIIRFMVHGSWRRKLKGIYTHFASAKDINYPTYTNMQFKKFQKAIMLFQEAGFDNLVKHAAATGGTLIDKKYHLDAVRMGIGLYGMWPSRELEVQLGQKIILKPILSWKAVVSETKNLKAGDYVGYDLAERVPRSTKMAVLPVGYWHGFPRSLSSMGEVLIHGRRAKVLGRVSMDLLVVDTGGIPCASGDVAILIGSEGREDIPASLAAQRANTIHYEFLTRLNPLIERILI